MAIWRPGVGDEAGAMNVLFHLLVMRLGEEEPDAWFCRGSDGPRLASYQDNFEPRSICCPVDWSLSLYPVGNGCFWGTGTNQDHLRDFPQEDPHHPENHFPGPQTARPCGIRSVSEHVFTDNQGSGKRA